MSQLRTPVAFLAAFVLLNASSWIRVRFLSGAAFQVAKVSGLWNVVGTADFSAGSTYFTSIALDSAGTPFVAYYDGSNGGKSTVQHYDAGSGWTVVGSAGFSAGTTSDVSLAIDSTTGTPFVAYFDRANNGKATVQKFEAGSGWTVVGRAGFSAGSTSYTSLALDCTGTPFVAYQDGANGGRLTVQKFTAWSGWTVIGTAGFSAGTAYFTSLAIDSTTGTPFVAYSDGNNGYKVTVQRFVAGSGWTVVGTPGFSVRTAQYTSLAIEKTTGTPFVAYRDYANGEKATVQYYDAEGGWTVIGTAGFSAGQADYVSLALDSTGTPFVAYQDVANGNKSTVQKFTAGSGWTVVGTAGFSAGQAAYVSLALDSTGTPYVAYRDDANGNKATVQKVA